MGTNNTKQAAWIAAGSLFAYGFGIVSSMILSRYFDKPDYGTYKQVLYVYNTLLTVFTLGLPRAYSYFIPRVKLSQAKNMIRKITNLFFALGTIFSLTLFCFSNQIAVILKNPDLGVALRIFAIVPFLMLPTMGLEGILATFKKTKFMAMYTISTRILKLVCVALPVIVWDLGYKEALWGFVISDVIAFVLAMYLKNMPVRNEANEKCNVSIKEIFKFSLPLLYASLWAIVINSADQFFISRYFGTETFAEFSNGNIDMPFVGMIVGACSAILSPIFSRMNHEDVDPKTQIFPLWRSSLEKSALFIYPLVIFCFVFADDCMTFLYSEKYIVSSTYFRIRLISNFFKVVAYAPLIINIGKVRFYSNVHMFTAFAIVILEYLSVIIFHNPYAISIVSVICHIGLTLIFLSFIAKLFGVKFYQLFPIKTLTVLLASGFLSAFAIRFAISFTELHLLVRLAVEVILFFVLYIGVTALLKVNYNPIIKALIKK